MIDKTILKWIGIILIVITGVIHFIDAPDSFSESSLKGILFTLNGIGALIAAYGIYRNAVWGWLLGLLIAGGAIFGYILSRTIGLPGMEVDPAWFETLGVFSLVVEGLFLLASYTYFIGWKNYPEKYK